MHRSLVLGAGLAAALFLGPIASAQNGVQRHAAGPPPRAAAPGGPQGARSRFSPPPPPAGTYARPLVPLAPYPHPGPGAANSLGADWRFQQQEARAGVRQGQMAPLGQVIEGIRRRSPGRELDAGIEYQDGRPVYRVRWMTDQGRRTDYIVDAATGQILNER